MQKCLSTILFWGISVSLLLPGAVLAVPGNASPDKQPTFHKLNGSETGIGISGVITETMNAAGYTYLQLENKGERTWVAIPATKVSTGDEITCLPGMEMRNFESKTLNRTFDTIIFSSGIAQQPATTQQQPGNTPAATDSYVFSIDVMLHE